MKVNVTYASLYGAGSLKLGLAINPNLNSIEYDSNTYNKHKKLLESKCILANGIKLIKTEANTFMPYSDDLVLYSIYGEQKRDLFMNGTVGLKELIANLEESVSNYRAIITLDGRKIYTEAKHKALNYLCQSSCAIFMKYYLCEVYAQLKKHYILQKDYAFTANIHDALIIECLDNEELISNICKILENALVTISNKFNFSYTMGGKAKAGNNFYEIFKD